MSNLVTLTGIPNKKKVYAKDYPAGTIFSADRGEGFWIVTTDTTLVNLTSGYEASSLDAWIYGEVLTFPATLTLMVRPMGKV